MSMESAKAFMERIKTDVDFCKKVNDCKDNEARMLFVKSAGYEFTKDDIELLKAELSDDELNGVVGGLDCSFWDWIAAKIVPRIDPIVPQYDHM